MSWIILESLCPTQQGLAIDDETDAIGPFDTELEAQDYADRHAYESWHILELKRER